MPSTQLPHDEWSCWLVHEMRRSNTLNRHVRAPSCHTQIGPLTVNPARWRLYAIKSARRQARHSQSPIQLRCGDGLSDESLYDIAAEEGLVCGSFEVGAAEEDAVLAETRVPLVDLVHAHHPVVVPLDLVGLPCTCCWGCGSAEGDNAYVGCPAFSGHLNWCYFMLRAAGSGTRRGPLAGSGTRSRSEDASDYSGVRCTGQYPPGLSFSSGKWSGGPARLSVRH